MIRVRPAATIKKVTAPIKSTTSILYFFLFLDFRIKYTPKIPNKNMKKIPHPYKTVLFNVSCIIPVKMTPPIMSLMTSKQNL